MKKMFRFFTIAALAFGMTMAVGCGKPDDGEDNGGGNGGGGNTENLPTTLNETFDNGIPSTWTTIDADGDGYNWRSTLEVTGSTLADADGNGAVFSQSYDNTDGVLNPDNYLVTPKIYIDGTTLTWQVAAQDASYPNEHYAVLVGTIENGVFVSKGTLFEETFSGTSKAATSFYNRSVSLADYKGQSLCIAFRHYNCSDMFYLNIDNVKVQ